jgi:hypothetical protein
VYGLRLKSVTPLPCPASAGSGPVEAEIVAGSADLFHRARKATGLDPNGNRWFQHARLADGSDYLRWSGLFEFLIAPDGRRIACRSLDGPARAAFQTYVLGQVLSFALLKRGIEPLHATAVVIDERAVGFVGDCGYGKSSLGAAFLQAGHRLLTDDLLVIRDEHHGFLAYPGPPRIKLFPEIAQTLLGDGVTGAPMNPQTSKLVIPLGPHQAAQAAVPLRTIYVLRPPTRGSQSTRVTIRTLSQRRACMELIASTFNLVVVEPTRLKRQFDLAARIARRIPVKSLTYPRSLASLPAVRRAILTDVKA